MASTGLSGAILWANNNGCLYETRANIQVQNQPRTTAIKKRGRPAKKTARKLTETQSGNFSTIVRGEPNARSQVMKTNLGGSTSVAMDENATTATVQSSNKEVSTNAGASLNSENISPIT